MAADNNRRGKISYFSQKSHQRWIQISSFPFDCNCFYHYQFLLQALLVLLSVPSWWTCLPLINNRGVLKSSHLLSPGTLSETLHALPAHSEMMSDGGVSVGSIEGSFSASNALSTSVSTLPSAHNSTRSSLEQEYEIMTDSWVNSLVNSA